MRQANVQRPKFKDQGSKSKDALRGYGAWTFWAGLRLLTPKASFIPAWGNAPGKVANKLRLSANGAIHKA
jgi:hypothetical protein